MLETKRRRYPKLEAVDRPPLFVSIDEHAANAAEKIRVGLGEVLRTQFQGEKSNATTWAAMEEKIREYVGEHLEESERQVFRPEVKPRNNEPGFLSVGLVLNEQIFDELGPVRKLMVLAIMDRVNAL